MVATIAGISSFKAQTMMLTSDIFRLKLAVIANLGTN